MSFIVDSHETKTICEKHICLDCIGNDFFKNTSSVSEKLINRECCDYCGEEKLCIPVQDIVELIDSFLSYFYEESEQLDVDGEGVWGDDLWDVLDQEIRDEIDDDLWEDVVNCFDGVQKLKHKNDTTWDFEVDSIYSLWGRFCSKRKYENPFFTKNKEEDRIYKSNLFSFAKRLVGILRDFNLFKEIPAGQIIYRCRNINEKDKVIPTTEEELGAAPNQYAKTGTRMCPAGIGLFYAAEDMETAVKEALGPDNARCVVGKWQTIKPLLILDLVELPQTGEKIRTLAFPSIFDSPKLSKFEEYSFLVPFVNDISRPIDENIHELDYRPTQMLCAYIMNHCLIGRCHVDGIRFSSAKTENGINFCGFWGNTQDKNNKNVELLDIIIKS